MLTNNIIDTTVITWIIEVGMRYLLSSFFPSSTWLFRDPGEIDLGNVFRSLEINPACPFFCNAHACVLQTRTKAMDIDVNDYAQLRAPSCE